MRRSKAMLERPTSHDQIPGFPGRSSSNEAGAQAMPRIPYPSPLRVPCPNLPLPAQDPEILAEANDIEDVEYDDAEVTPRQR
jgi:hypothetical protein